MQTDPRQPTGAGAPLAGGGAAAPASGADDPGDDAFRFASFSIDRWLQKVPHGYLAGTVGGRAPGHDVPEALLREGPLREIAVLDLALFIGAERVGARTAAGLARLAPDEGSLVFLASQTLDEARHFESFATRFRELGIPEATRDELADQFMPPSYRAFLDRLLEAVDRGDFFAGVVGLNVILEGMAFPLYDYEIRYWRPFDPGLAEVIRHAFLDEVRHVGFGEKRIAHTLARDPGLRGRIQRTVTDMGRAMRAAFGEFIGDYVALYDHAVAEHPEVAAQVEIIPGKSLRDTSTEEQVRWLEHEILGVHRKRMARIGLDYEV